MAGEDLPAFFRSWLFEIDEDLNIKSEADLDKELQKLDLIGPHVLHVKQVKLHFEYKDESLAASILINTSGMEESKGVKVDLETETWNAYDEYGYPDINREARMKTEQCLKDMFTPLIRSGSDGSLDAATWKRIIKEVWRKTQYEGEAGVWAEMGGSKRVDIE